MKKKALIILLRLRGKYLIPGICSLLFSFSLKAQTDGCSAVGWVNYNNTSFVGPPTGGSSATPVTVTTISQLKTEANSTGAKVIYVQGVMGAGYMDGGGERVDVKSDKTIIGYPGAQVNAYFSVKNANNVIIRNLIIQGPGSEDVDGWDNMTIDNSTRVWIDHCEFKDGEDGNLDIKNGSNNITVTWTKFQYTSVTQNRSGTDHTFSNLIGSSDDATEDEGKLKVTFQYNWWDGAVERMPRVRYGQVHVANNLFTEVSGMPVSKSGVTAGYDANVRVENNAFIGIDDPIDVSKLEGSAVIQSINNLFSGTSGNTSGSGTAFTPPYSLTLAANTVLNTTTFKNCVGATLSAPPASTCPCSSSLPVELISFEVFPQEENYLLTWKITETETLEEISIETSSDGVHFNTFQSLSKEEIQHLISGSEFFVNAIRYVRLKFIESDGTFSYSPVRAIGEQDKLWVYPNPFTTQIHVEGVQTGLIQISTPDGKILYEGQLTETGDLHLEHLPEGFYLISIYHKLTHEVKRISLIKQ